MINYFFFPDSYREIGTTLIKNSIEDLNKALLRKDKNETFYEDYSFYTIEYSDGLSLYAKLAQSHKDLTNRVMPNMLKRMKHTSKISDDIAQLIAAHTEAWANCLWGWCAVEDRNYICSYDFFCSNRKAIARSVINGTIFIDLSSLLFDRIHISSSAMRQICNLGSGGDFLKVVDAICSLDLYNSNTWNTGSFQVRTLQKEYNVTISDESDTVKRTPRLRAQRYFKVSEKIGSQYCFYHVKLDDTMRMHIFPEESERVIHITYVGAHLDLK